ncbi:MAG TPA: hypothetical protein VFV47_08435, partial [Hyphomicrobiaceae bacterium]|nr:hypothetical protein [Hyphomicrobiaceae bacterium]
APRGAIFLASAAAVVVAAMFLLVSPIRQNPAYNVFCDTRALLGIPNVLNVLSNLPFLFVGLAGLRWMRQQAHRLKPELRASYSVLFVGLAGTAAGSAWYHWAPDNARLFWDRLPIAVAFMGLYTAVIAERIDIRAAKLLLVPLVVFGAGSVVWWGIFDDLRPYAIAQFFPVVTIPVLIWLCPPMYTRGGHLLAAVGCYVVAKIFEELDVRIYALGSILSGHTLKHLAAGLGAWIVYRMLVKRRELSGFSTGS